MNARQFCLCVLAAGPIALGAAPVTAQEEATGPSACATLEGLAWMLGDWRVETEGTVFTERWHRGEDGLYHGEADSRRAGETEVLQREVMTLGPRGGQLVYTVDVDADGRTVDFTLVSCDVVSARFENPEHDFPQRLEYRRHEDGRLGADVTDLDGQGFDLLFEPAGEGG